MSHRKTKPSAQSVKSFLCAVNLGKLMAKKCFFNMRTAKSHSDEADPQRADLSSLEVQVLHCSVSFSYAGIMKSILKSKYSVIMPKSAVQI